MPPVEEWSCLVTTDDRTDRSEETTDAQESSQDVSMPRMRRGCEEDRIVEDDRKVRWHEVGDSRKLAEVELYVGMRWAVSRKALPMLRVHMLVAINLSPIFHLPGF